MSGEATWTEPSRCTVAVGEAILHKKALFCWGGLCAVTADATQTTTKPMATETWSHRSAPGFAVVANFVTLAPSIEV